MYTVLAIGTLVAISFLIGSGKAEIFVYISIRGELSYLAPLGSENISAPYFKQCFFLLIDGKVP